MDRNPGAIAFFTYLVQVIRPIKIMARPWTWHCRNFSSTRGRGSGVPAARHRRRDTPSSCCFTQFSRVSRRHAALKTRKKSICCVRLSRSSLFASAEKRRPGPSVTGGYRKTPHRAYWQATPPPTVSAATCARPGQTGDPGAFFRNGFRSKDAPLQAVYAPALGGLDFGYRCPRHFPL